MSRSGPTPIADVLAALPAEYERKAEALEPYAPPAARAFRECAAMLRDALRQAADELLSLTEAAAASGYSERRLRELIADGTIPQAGRKGAPRIRRADLPKRAKRDTSSTYDPDADARDLFTRRRVS